MASGSADMARKTWEIENRVETMDEVYRYDKDVENSIRAAKPWEKNPHYFKEVRISALALLKMVMHARSGGNLEIMGLIQGKVEANTLIVMDSFALPVEGTETRVNAQAQAYEYMTTYTESCEPVHRYEKVLGWYHSHPGYGCWLSGIDVSTQHMNQQYQDPWVAIVIDPIRTISAGRVDLGAFRTYPKGYKPPEEGPSEYQSIPLNKIEDFGVHCKQYYPLDVSYFKSALDSCLLDSLWNKYWMNTLSSTGLITNADYITGQVFDLADKLDQCDNMLSKYNPMYQDDMKKNEDKLSKAMKDSSKLTGEVLHGLMAQVLKHIVFNTRHGHDKVQTVVQAVPVENMEEDSGAKSVEHVVVQHANPPQPIVAIQPQVPVVAPAAPAQQPQVHLLAQDTEMVTEDPEEPKPSSSTA